MVTWAKFRDRTTGRELHFWNTPLDHAVHFAREKSAELIRQRIALLPPGAPLFLVGDFNSVARENRAYEVLTRDAGLTGTWFTAHERRNQDANSFTGFRPLLREGKRVGWILARGAMDVRAMDAVTFQQGGRWPSDHLPIMTWVTLRDPSETRRRLRCDREKTVSPLEQDDPHMRRYRFIRVHGSYSPNAGLARLALP